MGLTGRADSRPSPRVRYARCFHLKPTLALSKYILLRRDFSFVSECCNLDPNGHRIGDDERMISSAWNYHESLLLLAKESLVRTAP